MLYLTLVNWVFFKKEINIYYKAPTDLFFYRYDRFMDAFEHVSQRIDDIYKVSKSFSVFIL